MSLGLDELVVHSALLWRTHLDADEVLWFEVIGGAAAPVHYMFVLALTAQLTVPVGDAQVVVHQGVTHVAVPEHRVEEGLWREDGGEHDQTALQQLLRSSGTCAEGELKALRYLHSSAVASWQRSTSLRQTRLWEILINSPRREAERRNRTASAQTPSHPWR